MNGGFRELHPLICFLYYAGVLTFSMTFLHPLFLVTMIFMIVLLIFLQRGGKQLRSSFPYFLLMGLMIAVWNPLFNHRGKHVLFYIWENAITVEALLSGMTMMLSLLSILIAFVSYNQVITSGKFLFLFARFLPKGALLVMLSVRFVPLLKRRLQQIRIVQKTKGIDPLYGPLKKRLQDGMDLLQILLTWSLEEGLQTADSMKGRGYGLSRDRTSYIPYAFTRLDAWIGGIFVLAIGICLTGRLLGFGRWNIYPVWEGSMMQTGDWLIYISFLVFVVIPVAIEGREKWRWGLSS